MKSNVIMEDEHFLSAALKAVVIYDDAGYAARATAFLERAGVGADQAMHWEVKSWRLEVLRQPALAIIPLAVAADANLIVLALNGTSPPLEELLNWLEHWAANRHVEDAAVTLLGPATDADVLLRNELARFARRRGLTYWDARGAGDDDEWAGLQPPSHEEPLDAPKLRLLAETAPAPDHWGIND